MVGIKRSLQIVCMVINVWGAVIELRERREDIMAARLPNYSPGLLSVCVADCLEC